MNTLQQRGLPLRNVLIWGLRALPLPAALWAALPRWAGWSLAAGWCLLLLWLGLYFAKAGWAVRGGALIWERGVLWRRKSILPVSGVTGTGVWVSPLQRALGVCTLWVWLPGRPVVLEGLPLGRARELEGRLRRGGTHA